PVPERADEVGVVRVPIFGAGLELLLEAPFLLVGIGEFGVRIPELIPTVEELEALDAPGEPPMPLGERRGREGVVEDESRAGERGLDVVLEQLVEEDAGRRIIGNGRTGRSGE